MKRRISSRQITDELYPPTEELERLIKNEGETSLARYFPGYERAARRYLRRNRFDPSTQTVEAFFDDLCRHMAVVAVDCQYRQERIEQILGKLRDTLCREARRVELYALRVLGVAGIARDRLAIAEMQALADQLVSEGFYAHLHQASTGSLYVYGFRRRDGYRTEFEVRLSDHSPHESFYSKDLDCADCRTIKEARAAVKRLKSHRTLVVEDD
jgi:hypothetical protein